MARKCERPSCSDRGEVAYVIDTANLLVSIDAPIPRDSSRVNILCRRHADSLVVPRDWQIIDNRAKKQRLFSSPEIQSDRTNSQSGSVNKKRRKTNTTGVVIQDLFDFATRVVAPSAPAPESISETESVREASVAQVEDVSVDFVGEVEDETENETIDAQETQAMPWTPQFDRTGDLDGRLLARGKLLSRAFGGFEDTDRGHDQGRDQDHDQQHPEYE